MKKLLIVLVALNLVCCAAPWDTCTEFYTTSHGAVIVLHDGLKHPDKHEMEYTLDFFALKYARFFGDYAIVKPHEIMRMYGHTQIDWANPNTKSLGCGRHSDYCIVEYDYDGIQFTNLFHELSHMVLEFIILGHPDDDHLYEKNWKIVNELVVEYTKLENSR